jgi:hypothetical protein
MATAAQRKAERIAAEEEARTVAYRASLPDAIDNHYHKQNLINLLPMQMLLQPLET